MNCETAQDLFLDFVEGDLDAEAAANLQAHAESCPACRLALQQTRDLLGAMGRIKEKEEAASAASAHRRSQALPAELADWNRGGRLGDFEIISEIGRGGMGIVYRARQISLNRLVALKVLPGIFRQVPTAVTRFQKEAQAAAKLHHTNIVPVYAQGEYEGHCFYAMELIEGDSLDRILRREPARLLGGSMPAPGVAGASGITTIIGGRRQSYRFLARLFAGVAEGLDHAHKQGVIHRDIKPQNLLMAGDGQLHITDFGLARLLDEPSITLTGEQVGTPSYMSPEQITGDRRAIDHRTDIYSLGVTLYETLTGQRPFDGATRDQVTARILTREPRSPRRINPHIPADLETICLRAMEKEPPRRYQSAADLAADLRRFADDRPILIRRAGWIERSVKWVRRHPALSTIYGLLLILLVGGTTWRLQTTRARLARANELVQQAFDLLAHQDYHEDKAALAKLSAAADLGPDPWSYRRALGFACLGKDQPRAIEHLSWAVAQRPDDTTTMYLLAWALRLKSGRLDPAAKQWLDKADALGGAKTAEAHFFRGQVLVREEDQAEEEYRQARALKPDYTQALVHLGRALNHWMYHHRKHDKFHEQTRALESVCMVAPDQAYPRYLLSLAHRLSAEIYLDAGDATDAEKDFELAIASARDAQKVEAKNPRGYIAEAEYWETRRDYENALKARDRSEPLCAEYERILELHQYRWRLHYWMGEPQKAMKDLERFAALCDESNAMRAWALGLFPSLIAADRGKMDDAAALNMQMAANNPRSFRAVTTAACMLRILGRRADADSLLARHADQVRFEPSGEAEISPDFMRAAYELCRHRLAPDAVLKTAPSNIRPRLLNAIPGLYQGADALADRNREKALAFLRQSDVAYDSDDYCYLARVFVRKMERDPAWPAWIEPKP